MQGSIVIQQIEQVSEHLNWPLMALQLWLIAHQANSLKICISDDYLASSLLDKFTQLHYLALAHASMNMVKQTNHS